MGILIALTIIVSWCSVLLLLMAYSPAEFTNPLMYAGMLLMTFLYTGLFITAHDSMHGTVSRNRFANDLIGRISCFLFASFSYGNLFRKHHMHHKDPTGENDPDFGKGAGNFLVWFIRFIFEYSTVSQFILMALIFNIISYFFGEGPAFAYWLIPSVLSSIQLFYFGTYLPHRHPETGLQAPHFARSQRKNHLTAFLTCYFFGYHHEHHASPGTPWWKLYKLVS
ncbi:MAG: fatty acid desaturase [Ignavibacteria bacterium]|nr:fatty acid desaturase [Ignavibacteria bacterium]